MYESNITVLAWIKRFSKVEVSYDHKLYPDHNDSEVRRIDLTHSIYIKVEAPYSM